MTADIREQVTFHVTGKRLGAHLGAVETVSLRPALMTAYRDLARLRYDFPMVLVHGDADGANARSLSSIINGILHEIAPKGIEGERTRKHVLGLESEIRAQVRGGAKGQLTEMWEVATKLLLAKGQKRQSGWLAESLEKAKAALNVDGRLLDCHGGTAVDVVVHAWNAIHRELSRRVFEEIDELAGRLAGVLRAHDSKPEETRSAEGLKSVVGRRHEALFDFQAMADVLESRESSEASLSEGRRKRIQATLDVLEKQKFFARPCPTDEETEGAGPHSFVFSSCASALAAFQERLPAISALVKAISVAKLEAGNGYDEAKHDVLFEQFDETCLLPEDYAMFPPYVVRLCDGEIDEAEQAKLIEILSSGLPFKILFQTDDILTRSPLGNGQGGGISGLQIASMVLGLGNAFVLQSSAAQLGEVAGRIRKGIEYDGPALFCVFSGANEHASQLPVYLRAAAATQSRTFPSFSFDPSAGPDWASRFSIDGNPQLAADWPVGEFTYEDAELQRQAAELAFTFVDFAACDARYAEHFAMVPLGDWHENMVPASECLGIEENESDEQAKVVPYILMVDKVNTLHRVAVDDKMLRTARHFVNAWRSLQELGGINNSHAARLLAREREVWEKEKQEEIAELKASGALAGGEPSDTDAAAARAAAGAAAKAKGEPVTVPFIDTLRCSTCNECTNKNPLMFKYNENKQAYIADLNAGSYKDLVEAAEKCQVAIIHPGQPRNSDEPDLEDLKKRAAPFN